ncbi:DMT family transporter [Aestuariimicrobium soli]|uniref:DMT family transporter n=1 Tax=Aestuariimicrobium soli TaxID=2035834 RepID=UPI003EBCF579
MAVLWGSTLVVMKDLLAVMGATDLVFVRFAIAALALLLIVPRALRMSRRTLLQGIGLGLLFVSGQLASTWGLLDIDASVSGFLTGLYIVATPLLGWAMFRARPASNVWAAVAMSTLGLAALSLGSAGSGIGQGELLTLMGAVLYAVHILAIGRVVTPRTAMSLTLVQTITIAVATAFVAVPDGVSLPSTAALWWKLAYLAVICGALPLALQVWAQAHVEATKAAVVMGTEPLWGALFAVGLGGESVTLRLLLGGTAIMVAIALVIAPVGRWRGRATRSRGRVTAARTEVGTIA